jgi:crossover junction endodeoxyribonuclease RuvC
MNTPPRPIRILGIDPGLRHCGWGVIDQQGNALHFVAAGVIHPPAQEAITARLRYLHDGLQQVIHTYQPQEIALEESFVSLNGQSTLKLGQARGAIQLSVALSGLPLTEYAARLVKKSITGSGKADKIQMQTMVKLLLPQSSTTNADAADALAIAICHAHHRGIALMGRN